ncbi:MATE family efflux transporter [Sulfurimonas sp. MAG313]|nr:MATE family efflux transporter [Sulfurimonas sp. MAG313]MDF1881573.1 MATE family efflux transporter [Sulfurimonas sp. MAG313]
MFFSKNKQKTLEHSLSLENKSSLSKILSISIPAALKNLLDMVQILIDLIMVGTLGVASLAAVGLGMQFIMVLNAIMNLYVVGGNAVISRYIGAGRFHKANITFFNLLLLALALSLISMYIGSLGAKEFYIWIGTGEEVASLGKLYFGTLSLGMPLIFLDALYFNALSAAGKTKASLFIKIVSALINVLLNYILIFGHFGFEAMGIEGAAIATLISYGFNVVVYTILVSKESSALRFYFYFSMSIMKSILKIGLPASIERLISVASFMVFVLVITKYGTQALAGYQVGLRIEGIAFMPGFGFSIAAMALVGQSLGARNSELAYNEAKTVVQIAAGFMGFIGLFLIFMPEVFCRYFTQDEQTIELASVYLRLVGLSQIPLAVVFVLSGALRGAGATRSTLKLNVGSLIFLRVLPSIYVSTITQNIFWIYIIMITETYIKGGLFWYVFSKGEWKNIKL